MRKMSRAVCSFVVMLTAAGQAAAQAEAPAAPRYQRPMQAIQQILDAAPTPDFSLSPNGEWILLADSERYPTIAELSRPMLRLAGARINPANNGPHTSRKLTSYTIQRVSDGSQRRIAFPGAVDLGPVSWSPDSKQFAFVSATPDKYELWVGDTEKATVRRMDGIAVNLAQGLPVAWLTDNKTIVTRLVPAGRGKPPVRAQAPMGPHVEESYGRAAPAPTFQDLLEDAHDELLFDYYFTSQLALVDAATGKATPVGEPKIFGQAEFSPDGQHVLVSLIHRPYSYLLTAGGFAREVEVWDRTGKLEYKVASVPLAEGIPQGGVPTGPRGVDWHPLQPATLTWVEALDDGNPRKKVPHRDRVMLLRAPFTGEKREYLKTEHRHAGLLFGERGAVGMLREFDRDKQMTRTWFFNTFIPTEIRLGWEINTSERYKNPGNPVMRRLRNGQMAMAQDGGEFIYLSGAGATPEGDRPFLDSFDTNTMTSERLFQSDTTGYESFVAFAGPKRDRRDMERFVTRHESSTEPPNYFLRTAKSAERRALTQWADPAPQLRGIKKQLVKYKREDGVDLSFTLYLPPDYKPGERRPGVVWAYPLEFTDASVAGQVSGSPNRFFMPVGPSHLFYLLAGYVVMDNATMPIIGDPVTVNNTFVQQLATSAQAAIAKGDEMGVLDPQRVGVAGHSYGAFMTANLLAHTDLFRAGVARSGAYNRTLTPFGFQSERRTLWEARDMYINISPFLHAQKIQEPILLIHGEADNNSGTFPIQSERMYRAVKGNGGNVRYVTLPHESHGYAARESVEHTLWEMLTWFDRHVKNAGARQTTTAAAKE